MTPCAAAALALVAGVARACDADSVSVSLFRCDAAGSRKFIELCSPSPIDARTGYLYYRFGSLDTDGSENAVELEYPADNAGSLRKFYAATYTHEGIYIFELKGLVPCDPETPVGTACVK